MRTYQIELRTDFEGDAATVAEKEAIMVDAVKSAAKHMLAEAMLLSGKRRPQIALESGDLFAANEEISLADDFDAEGVDESLKNAVASMNTLEEPEEIEVGDTPPAEEVSADEDDGPAFA